MKRKTIVILWLILWTSHPACAGYRDLKNDYTAYRPPAYFEAQFRPVPAIKKPGIDEAFVMQLERIKSMKSGWETEMVSGERKEAFFHPDPARLNTLKPAGMNGNAAARILKRPYALADLEILALLRNAGIKAAENRFRGALESFSQVAALDEILREYSALTEGLMTAVGPMKGKEPMRTKFPFPGVLALKGQVVHQQVLAERESLEIVRRDALTEVRKAYWDVVYVIRETQITAEMLELLRQLEAVAGARYEAGKTSYQDVIKTRINRKTLEVDLTTMEERRRNVESGIRAILHLPLNVELAPPEMIRSPDKSPALDTLVDIARDRRQELRRLRALLGKTERMIEMAETMIFPSYALSFSFYEDEAVSMTGSAAKKETFPVQTQAATGVGLPKMPWYGTEDAYLRETRQKLYALEAELNQAEVSAHTLVRIAWFELNRSWREVALYRDDIVQLSRSALNVSKRGYESGTVSFADVMDSYTTWLRANLVLAKTQSDLGVAWAKLEQVVGVSLQ